MAVYLGNKKLVTSADLPTATSNTLGIARPDGVTIVISNGVISLASRNRSVQNKNDQEK